MSKSKATKRELVWMAELEDLLLNAPPRIGLYTIGDHGLVAYDVTKEQKINEWLDQNNFDFCHGVDHLKAEFDHIKSKPAIHATCG